MIVSEPVPALSVKLGVARRGGGVEPDAACDTARAAPRPSAMYVASRSTFFEGRIRLHATADLTDHAGTPISGPEQLRVVAGFAASIAP